MNDINTIWKEYYNMLIRFVQNRVQDKSIAEDILQEVFIRIYNKLDTLKDPEKIQSWVFQITRNAIIDYYRSHKPTEELPEEVNESEWSLDDHDKKEMSSCFMSLIQNLPENYRAALIMAEIDGFKQKEVLIINTVPTFVETAVVVTLLVTEKRLQVRNRSIGSIVWQKSQRHTDVANSIV